MATSPSGVHDLLTTPDLFGFAEIGSVTVADSCHRQLSTYVDFVTMSRYVDIVTRRQIHTSQRLGAAIKDARRGAGLTQAQLAAKAGVSRAWLIEVEAGTNERAEFGKVLSTIQALDLSIEVAPSDDVVTAAEAAARDYFAGL